MRGRLLVLLLSVGLAGCASRPSARYIYQDGEFGVIGIPQNTPYGGRNYRAQAEEMMRSHFPEGHEIVRVEEVVEGQRQFDKTRGTEFVTDPAINAFGQKIDLGKFDETVTTQQKDSLPILESRIIYRRRAPGAISGPSGFSAVATLGPELYLDPNETTREREKLELAGLKAAKGGEQLAESPKDAAAKQAVHEAPPAAPSPPPGP
jgi:hypothetical protein